MKRREFRSVVVTGFFLAVLAALIAAGIAPGIPEAEQLAAPEAERDYVPYSQFLQYLEYRARLENGSSCR